MAYDNEHRLVSALCRQKQVRRAVERGLQPEWFHVSDHRLVYQWMLEYYDTYGTTPSAATLKDNFPGYSLIKVTDPVDYFIDQLVAYNREQAAISLVSEAADRLADKDPEGALESARTHLEGASDFQPIPVFITDLVATVQERWDAYAERSRKGSPMLGLESGYPAIDRATLGLQPQQLIVLMAEAKRGKTTLCLNMGIHAHKVHDIRPLFISFEMSRSELSLRHDAIRAQVSLTRLQNGTLHADEEKRFGDMLDDLDTRERFILADASQGVTVGAVAAQIEHHDPGLVVVDGAYLMMDEVTKESNTPQALTNITRSLKRLAQQTRRPVVISTQALTWKTSKGRLRADSAGYSSSFAQDADVLLGLEEGNSDNMRMLRIVLSRNSGLEDVDIDFDYETGRFGQTI